MKWLLTVCSVWLVPAAMAEPVPPVDDLLRTARYVTALQQHDLKGHLRKDGKKVPVALFLNRTKGDIQFQFYRAKEKIWQRFHTRLNEDHYDLFEIQDDGKTRAFPTSKLSEPIGGSDLTYEDLAMRFLYWPGGKVVGSEKIKGQDCWKIRLHNPERSGLYKVVDVAVHKKAGALFQVIGYDQQGRAIKGFQVSDLMKVGDAYTLRSMRVNTYEPVSRKTIGITYLEFEKPTSSGPGAFR